MEFTIRPLRLLFKDKSRDYVKRGDLVQILQKVQNTQHRQLQQGIPVPAATREYIKILEEMIRPLTPKTKLLKTELARRG